MIGERFVGGFIATRLWSRGMWVRICMAPATVVAIMRGFGSSGEVGGKVIVVSV